MQILYCHDNVYIQDAEEQIYSEGQFSYEYWAPYLAICDDLIIAGRGRGMRPDDDLSALNQSSGEQTTIEMLPDMNSPMGVLKNKNSVQNQTRDLVQDVDAVIIRTMSEIGWVAFKAAQKLGKPIAHEIAGCPWDNTWNHGSLLAKLYAPLRYYRMKKIAQKADYVLYVSKDFLPKRYPATGETAIASNVRLEKPDLPVLARRLERIHSSASSDLPIEIGLIGSLDHKLKGIEIAIKAIDHINYMSERTFILKILGAGDSARYRPLIHKLERQNYVHFDGILSSGKPVLKWLDHIDIYIQPSLHEGVPRATIEAMSRGCPAFGSNAGGIPELLPPSYIHKKGQAVELAEQILKSVTEGTLEKQAQENFEKSKEYTQDILVPIRDRFWAGFGSFVQSKMDSTA